MDKSSKPMGRPARTVADRALMKKMGERLRWVREAMGNPSQDALTQQLDLGRHQTSWSLYERGLRWPDDFEAARLIAKLKITRAYLLEGSLEGVERELAIRLAANHPELVGPTDKNPRRGTGRS